MSTTSRMSNLTKLLLKCGIVAGPIYILTGILQILIRPGFNPTRHDLSLMSNGDLGWIQITNFIFTGLLTIAAAWGIKKLLQTGKGKTWGPLLIGLYGLGLIGAGVFVADPMNGFPPEMSSQTPVITTNGILHMVSGALGFLGLITACFVFAKRFTSQNLNKWATFSKATGFIYLLTFLGIVMGSQQGGALLTIVTLAFTVAVILGWTWISLVSYKFLKNEI